MPMRALDTVCPCCGVEIVVGYDTDIVARTPQICVVCRALVVLDPGLPGGVGWRRPTEAEEDWMLADPRVTSAIATIKDYHEKHGPPMGHRPDDGR